MHTLIVVAELEKFVDVSIPFHFGIVNYTEMVYKITLLNFHNQKVMKISYFYLIVIFIEDIFDYVPNGYNVKVSYHQTN